MAIARQAGSGQTAALEIESGQRLPTVATLARLASVLGVSASWLAYGLDDMRGHAQRSSQTADMATRLQLVRGERSISRAELGRRTGLSPRAIAKIEAGGQSGVDVIEVLAQALGISPAWLAFNEGPQALPARRRGRPPAQSSAPAS
jgi:transcriptional regulator with XRE-family HTH domain